MSAPKSLRQRLRHVTEACWEGTEHGRQLPRWLGYYRELRRLCTNSIDLGGQLGYSHDADESKHPPVPEQLMRLRSLSEQVPKPRRGPPCSAQERHQARRAG